MAVADPPARFQVRKGAADDPLVGTVVNGKYRVQSVVATGGMGRIYRAEQLPLGRPVALKVLNPQYTQSNSDDAFQKRFFLEASILSKLQHPNIVTVFDYGQIEDTDPEAYFMAMEFLAGETLHKRLNQVGALPASDAIGLARQLARGLREAHAHDVVHRDLKPSNVMLIGQEDGSELVKIVDFGLVKVLTDDSDHVTKEGTFLGSPRYMSPEQIAHGRVDHRTDLYSLGVILYQVLCGALPFDSDHAVQTLMAHLHNPVPWMAERNPDARVPEQLELFVRRCLEKDPAGRPASMEEFTREITEIEKSLGFAPAPGTAPGLAFDYDTGSGRRRPLLQPVPEVRTGPQPSTAREQRIVDPIDQPTIANPPPTKKPSALPIVLTAVGAVVIVVFGGLLLMRTQASQAQPATASSADSAARRERFTLAIVSTPGGADVFEGDSSLGKTPLNLDVDNTAVQKSPRKLVLRLEGYQPYTLEQGAVRGERAGDGSVGGGAGRSSGSDGQRDVGSAGQDGGPDSPWQAADGQDRRAEAPRFRHQAHEMNHPRMLRALAACAILCASVLCVQQSRADDLADEADLQFTLGAEKYQAGDYRSALEHFLVSNRLVPNKNVVFNIARAFEQLKQYPEAFRYYTTALDQENDQAARARIDTAIARISPFVAVLDIVTDPPGATIFIDRKDLGPRGSSPRKLALPPGKYKVMVEMNGYESADAAELEVKPGTPRPVRLSLKRILGTLQLQGEPVGADVRVDNETGPVTCKLPCKTDLPPGRHSVYVAHERYQPATLEVDVRPRATTVSRPRLNPLRGSLVVNTDERDAMVEVDGHSMGFTPSVLTVQAGQRTVRVSLSGFRPIERVVNISANQETRLDLELRQLDEVSAASRTTESVEDAPSSVSIIPQQELRAMAYPTIAEALRGVRGLFLTDDRAYGQVGFRGFSRSGDYGNRVLVLQDGMPTNDNWNGSSYVGFDARTDLEDIERIEVVRGPGSVLYGTGAFSGVINLVTRYKDQPTGGEVGVGTSEYGVARARGRVNLKFGKDAGCGCRSRG